MFVWENHVQLLPLWGGGGGGRSVLAAVGAAPPQPLRRRRRRRPAAETAPAAPPELQPPLPPAPPSHAAALQRTVQIPPLSGKWWRRRRPGPPASEILRAVHGPVAPRPHARRGLLRPPLPKPHGVRRGELPPAAAATEAAATAATPGHPSQEALLLPPGGHEFPLLQKWGAESGPGEKAFACRDRAQTRQQQPNTATQEAKRGGRRSSRYENPSIKAPSSLWRTKGLPPPPQQQERRTKIIPARFLRIGPGGAGAPVNQQKHLRKPVLIKAAATTAEQIKGSSEEEGRGILHQGSLHSCCR